MQTTLFGLCESVYTRIARLALEEKNVAYRLEADLHAYPMLAYLAQRPEGSEMCATHPALVRWMACMSKRPSARRTPFVEERGE